MAITSRDQLINALANNHSRHMVDRPTFSPATANTPNSMWRGTGIPAQGVLPAATTTCNHTTVGGIPFTQQSGGNKSYLGYFDIAVGVAPAAIEIYDRLMHMGGLNGTLTTAQSCAIDLLNVTADNMAERVGPTNYSEISWWVEWYVATGSTATNITINVTYHDGTTGNLTSASLAANRPAGWMLNLNLLVPAGTNKFIRGVNTVTLSASTGTAGNFGVTCTRLRASMTCSMNNIKDIADWARLGLPEIFNSSCLFQHVTPPGTATGLMKGYYKIIHG